MDEGRGPRGRRPNSISPYWRNLFNQMDFVVVVNESGMNDEINTNRQDCLSCSASLSRISPLMFSSSTSLAYSIIYEDGSQDLQSFLPLIISTMHTSSCIHNSTVMQIISYRRTVGSCSRLVLPASSQTLTLVQMRRSSIFHLSPLV